MKRTKKWHLEYCAELLRRADEQADLAKELALSHEIHKTRMVAVRKIGKIIRGEV